MENIAKPVPAPVRVYPNFNFLAANLGETRVRAIFVEVPNIRKKTLWQIFSQSHFVKL